MSKPIKGLSIAIVLAVCAALLAAVLYVGPAKILGDFIMRVTEDTQYAPGYSERAFQQIGVGDTEAAVKAALGAPLSESKAEPYVSWLYAPDAHPDFEASGRYPDMRFSFTEIKFDQERAFLGAFGQISYGSGGGSGSGAWGDGVNTLGITQAQIDEFKSAKATTKEIEAKYGKPNAAYESHVVRWLTYSTSPGSKNYRLRAIGIDRDGKVCRKQSEFYWD